jgi:serine/threonine protein kinase
MTTTLDRVGPIRLRAALPYDTSSREGVDERDGTEALVVMDVSPRRIAAARRLWSTVDHPAFARFLGASEGGAGEPAWFAAERLTGPTLYDHRDAGPAHPREAVAIARQLCVAAGVLHGRGHLLHVDGGEVHVGVIDGWPRVRLALTVHPRVLGESPGVVGPPQLEAPESLARGGAPDGRADVWRIGVLLYDMLTDRLPFGGETAIQVALAVTERKPDPFRVELGVPRALQQLVWRALERRADDRYPSAAAFEAALGALEL